MPIKRLTTDLQPHHLAKAQEIGYIRAGGPKIDSGKGYSTFGKKLQHFRFTQRDQTAKLHEIMYDLFGQKTPATEYKPTDGAPIRAPMTIYFLSNNEDYILDAYYRIFDKAGHLTHQCDGDYCQVYTNEKGEIVKVKDGEFVPCMLDCANDPRDEKEKKLAGVSSASFSFCCKELADRDPQYKLSTIAFKSTGKNSIGGIATGFTVGKMILDLLGLPITSALWKFWGEWKEVSTPKHGKMWAYVANLELIKTPHIIERLAGFDNRFMALEGGNSGQIQAAPTYTALPSGPILEADPETGEIAPPASPAKANQKTFHAVGVSLCGTAAAWDQFRPKMVAKMLKEEYTVFGDFSANRLSQEQINNAVELMNDAARLATEKPASLVKHLTERLFLDADFSSQFADNLFKAHTKIDLQKACRAALEYSPDVAMSLMAYADSGNSSDALLDSMLDGVLDPMLGF